MQAQVDRTTNRYVAYQMPLQRKSRGAQHRPRSSLETHAGWCRRGDRGGAPAPVRFHERAKNDLRMVSIRHVKNLWVLTVF